MGLILRYSLIRNAALREECPLSPSRDRHWILVLLAAAVLCLCDQELSTSRAGEIDPPSRIKQDSNISSRPVTIVDLQPLRQTTSIQIKAGPGGEGHATLINLNPRINVWYLLDLQWQAGGPEAVYHLENLDPSSQRLLLDSSHPNGIAVAKGNKKDVCSLWGENAQNILEAARRSGAPYVPICGGRLYLRNPTKGHRTEIEMVAEFLRDKMPGGEKIVDFVRDTFFSGVYLEMAQESPESAAAVKGQPQNTLDRSPIPALLDPKQGNRLVEPTHLGIDLQLPIGGKLALGAWYPHKDNPGIYLSVIDPHAIAPEILKSYRELVGGLDSIEAEALVFLVAFDLDRFDVKFALGTEHPRVDWSEHMLDQFKDKSLLGPDGIGSIAPLVSTGMINPRDGARTVATFAAGFKRAHGAFEYGRLAYENHGSHYGFMEQGVLFSKLQPHLSTLYVLKDGTVGLKTWSETDNQLLPQIKFARQNGVPIIADFDAVRQLSVPGALVSRWAEGNWSGSEDRKLRTIRAAAALQEAKGKRYLIYALFTNATPSAMARVFQAYRCHYAMHLDMNALEHTYLAIYKRQGSSLYIQHLIQEMSEVDMSVNGRYVPRFLGFADNRDFFYVMRKERP